MATTPSNIRIDARVKAEATAILTDLGLSLSDGVNIFLRKVIDERGIPFAVKKADSSAQERQAAFQKFLALARANPVFEKGEKFDREAIYDR